MRKRLAFLAAASLALAACEDRRAGTEVGNPEVGMTVSANFSVADNAGEVDVRHFDMIVEGMRYATLDSLSGGVRRDSGSCWYRPGGTLANLADWESIPLEDTVVPVKTWSRAEIILRTPDAPPLLPDAAEFDSWSDPRHVKFYLVKGTDTLRALFEMPPRQEIHLIFNQDLIQYWYWALEMRVFFYFDSGNWAGSLDPRGPWATRKDGAQRPYVLFSPAENAAAWSDLSARFSGSFIADSVLVR